VDPTPEVSVVVRCVEEASCRDESEGRVVGEVAGGREKEAARHAPLPVSGGEGGVEDAGADAREPCPGLPLHGGEEVAAGAVEHSVVRERSGGRRSSEARRTFPPSHEESRMMLPPPATMLPRRRCAQS
jgi:hypothetical protein